MRRMRWAKYLWPGLPQLWLQGSWVGLGMAVASAALLSLAMLATFGWSELAESGLLQSVWVAVVVAWVASAVLSLMGSRRQGSREQTDPAGSEFQKAVEHYLKGDWFQAERMLDSVLRKETSDPDARLMLATLLRHTRRFGEAAAQLELLAPLDRAGKWEWEIRRERELLRKARERIDGPDEEQTPAGSGEVPAENVQAA